MHTYGWKLVLIAALLALVPTTAPAEENKTITVQVPAPGASPQPTPAGGASKFDMTVVVADSSTKLIKMERTGPAKDFIQRAAIYLRYVPMKENTRVHPAFINMHNYLTCPDKGDKKWYLEGVSRVDFDKASGIGIYGFFFSRPECDDPTFKMEAIVADDEPAKDAKKKS
jgi:hypothetical protein